jgi:hypothetical protein
MEPLLGNVSEISKYTTAAAKQRPANIRVIMFSAESDKQQLKSIRNGVYLLSVPRCYKQDNWSKELVTSLVSYEAVATR